MVLEKEWTPGSNGQGRSVVWDRFTGGSSQFILENKYGLNGLVYRNKVKCTTTLFRRWKVEANGQ